MVSPPADRRTDWTTPYRVTGWSKIILLNYIMQSSNEYQLRISQNKSEATQILNEFQKKFKVNQMVACFEHKGYNEDGSFINPHSHAYIKYGVVPSKQSISDFFKKQALLKDECQAGYSHKIQKTSTDRNLVYVVKQRDIIINTIGDLKKWLDLSAKVDDEKKIPTRDKLYELWKEHNNNSIILPKSKFDIYKFIDELYVLKWKKNPLSASHLFSYSKYIIIKCFNEIEIKSTSQIMLYESLLCELNNIRGNALSAQIDNIKMLDEVYHEVDKKRDELDKLIKQTDKVKKEHDIMLKEIEDDPRYTLF